ncbi:MAG: hypothetical protein MJZ75_01575 [Paludibacteraceae bacterium]|nr:hypothetical protein [Paludibacteraceae bacterium]
MNIRDYIECTPCKQSRYQEDLVKPLWKKKRYEILSRDGFKCQHCGFVSIPQIESEEPYGLFSNVGQKYLVKVLPYPSQNIHFKSEKVEYITYNQIDLFELENIKRVILLYNGIYYATEWVDICSANAYISSGCTLHIYTYEVEGKKESYYISNKDSSEMLLIEQPIVIDQQYSYGQRLQVHHKYYIRGAHAWEYHNNALITLCSECHKAFHQNGNEIPIFVNVDKKHYLDDFTQIKTENDANLRIYKCRKCQGDGFIPEYMYVEDGVCFQCHGIGYIIRDIITNKILNEDIPLPSERILRHDPCGAITAKDDEFEVELIF